MGSNSVPACQEATDRRYVPGPSPRVPRRASYPVKQRMSVARISRYAAGGSL